jgi:mRNA-degrading endonuclease RelE of RelBE toxin-antitoxin system
MAYKLSLTKNFERDFKSFDPGAKNKIKDFDE